LCVATLLTAAPLPAFPHRPGAADPAAEAVAAVLKSEALAPIDRRPLLAGALAEYPNSEPARWQAGYVRDGEVWRAFEEPPDSGDRERLDAYLSRRSRSGASAREQLELADWCRKAGLRDREQAHLMAALAASNAPPDRGILARLSYQQVGSQWLSREEFHEWRDENQRAEASLRKWRPRLERLARRFAGRGRERETAMAELDSLQDESALAAVEFVLCGRSEDAAAAGVRFFRRVRTPDSSNRLARQAVFSKWGRVRETAAQSLAARPLDEFVPSLVGLLSTPVQSELRVSQFGRSGPLFYTYIMARETEDQFQVATISTVNSIVDDYLNGTVMRAPAVTDAQQDRIDVRIRIQLERGRGDAVRGLRDQVHVRESALTQANERIAELNGRIVRALAAATGRAPDSDPRAWWSWWHEQNEMPSSDQKRIVRIDEVESLGNPIPPEVMMYGDCLAAGTSVWTDRGQMSIEQIRPGDRVLAQHPESGELAYKPVLHVTVRPPKGLVALRMGDEIIVTTPGHRFWVAGTGWRRAREVAPQSLVHTARGSVPVATVKPAPPAETYNLVVADFHTCFVGRTGLLCQDLLIPRATSNLVPGLPRPGVAGAKSQRDVAGSARVAH
jgi:hypothetical protein